MRKPLGLRQQRERALEQTYLTPHLMMVPTDLIDPDPDQPRKHFDRDELDRLKGSIQAEGILQPLLLIPKEDGRFQINAGERRWRAATELGLPEVPAIVQLRSGPQALRAALFENLHRADLSPTERVLGVLRYIYETVKANPEVVQALEEAGGDLYLATARVLYRLDKRANWKGEAEGDPNPTLTRAVKRAFQELQINPATFIRTDLGLLHLPPDVLVRVDEGRLSKYQAREVARLPEAEVRRQVMEMVEDGGASVRSMREMRQGRKATKEAAAPRAALPALVALRVLLGDLERQEFPPEKAEKIGVLVRRFIHDLRALL